MILVSVISEKPHYYYYYYYYYPHETQLLDGLLESSLNIKSPLVTLGVQDCEGFWLYPISTLSPMIPNDM